MCGIVCASIFKREDNNDMVSKMIAYLFSTLMIETESRGNDATGLILHYDDGKWEGMKAGIEASKLLGNNYQALKNRVIFTNVYDEDRLEDLPEDIQTYQNFIRSRWIDNTDSPVRTLIGHCRKSTKGTATNNKNNHPIIAEPIIGVHNGKIENDDVIFELHKGDFNRDGEVDSEAVFKLMAALHPEDEVGDADYIKTVAMSTQIGAFHKDGTAVVAMHQDYPGVIYAFRKGDRPLEVCFSKELGVAFIISEQVFLKKQMLGFIVSDMCKLGYPLFNFEYKSIGDYKGFIINTNKELTDEMKIADIMEEFDIQRIIDTNYKKPEPKYTTTTTTTTQTSTTTSTAATSTATTTNVNETDEEDGDLKEVLGAVGRLHNNKFSLDYAPANTFNYISVTENLNIENEKEEKEEVEQDPLASSTNATEPTKYGQTTGIKVVDTINNKEEKETNSSGLTDKQRFILKSTDLKRFFRFRQIWEKEGIDKKYYSLLKQQYGEIMEAAFDLRTDQIEALKVTCIASLKKTAKEAGLLSKYECETSINQMLMEQDIDNNQLSLYLGFDSFAELIDEVYNSTKDEKVKGTEYYQG